MSVRLITRVPLLHLVDDLQLLHAVHICSVDIVGLKLQASQRWHLDWEILMENPPLLLCMVKGSLEPPVFKCTYFSLHW